MTVQGSTVEVAVSSSGVKVRLPSLPLSLPPFIPVVAKVPISERQHIQSLTLPPSLVPLLLNPNQVNNANVVATDVQASNGIIHVIDTVLLPGSVGAPASGAKPVIVRREEEGSKEQTKDKWVDQRTFVDAV